MRHILRKALLALAGAAIFSTSAMADTTIVGAEDNTTVFNVASSRSPLYPIAENQRFYVEFVNYTNTTMDDWKNWFNWVLIAQTADGTKDLLALRADNYGWNECYDATKLYTKDFPWDTFRASMDGATVRMNVSRENGRVSIYMLMNKGTAYWSESIFFDLPSTISASENINVYLTTENGHLVIDNDTKSTTSTTPNYYTVGAEDNSSLFFSAFSDYYTVDPGQTVRLHFKNYTLGDGNWQNWLAVVTNDKKRSETGYTEYLVLRNDHYGWGTKYNSEELTSAFVWDYDDQTTGQKFRDEMNGSDVVMTVSRSGATFTVYADITASDGTTKRWEKFVGTCDAAETLLFFLTTEKAHLQIQSAEAITISSYGWSTFSSDYALDFSKADAGLEAYIITGRDGAVVTKSLATGTVPAGTGLLLKGDASTAYNIPIVGSSDTDVSGNLLVAGAGAAVSYETGKTKYVLGVNGSNAEFQKIVEGTPATVDRGKAYLQFNEVVAAPQLSFFGDVTGIEDAVKSDELRVKSYYNLAGQRIAQPTKGLYIVNGKKVAVK